MRARSSGAMPGPVSDTASLIERRAGGVGDRRGTDLHMAVGGELDGVADQIEQHLAQPGRIDLPVTAQQIIVARLQLQPLVARLRLQRPGDLAVPER